MVPKGEAAVNPRLLGILCIAVICVILSLGLWPFHAPANDVTWLGSRNGLRLGHYSTVIGVAPLAGSDDTQAGFGSVEIWLQPARKWTGGTFLSFGQPDHSVGIRVQQSLTDLALERTFRGKAQKIYVDDVFQQKKPRFITVTAGSSGTVVYVDGVPAKRARWFGLSPADFNGRLILGDAPGQSDSWEGTLFGVAVYRGELTEAQVLANYRSWTSKWSPEANIGADCVALYLLNERSGRVVHNEIRSGGQLQIPSRYTVVDQRFLEPVWEEFSLSKSYWDSVLKNIVGFLPVGFVFYAYLSGVRGIRRGVLITVLVGALISFTIEVLQAFLPSRDSGTSDLITNTLGTWLGTLLYRRLHRQFAELLPWLPVFPEPRG